MNVLDSLLVALGYEFDDDGLKEFEKSLDSVTGGINTLALAAAGLVTAFVGTTVASAGATDELTKQAKRIGIATEELDAYNFAAEQTTGRSDSMSEALRQLAIRSSEAARGTGSAIEAFGILGISVTDSEGRVKSVNELLGQSADALNGLGNDAQRLELADKLGLSDLDLLLREGSSGINALVKEAKALGVVTAEDGKAAEEFNDQINRMQRVLTNTIRFVTTEMLPTLTDVAKGFQSWVQENKELIQLRLIQFLNAVTFAIRNFQSILIAILSLKFAVFLLRMVAAYRALGAAALIANVKMFSMVIAIAAVIAAIGLLIEDFIVWQRGGESAIGALIEKFPLLDKALKVSRAFMADFFEFFFGMIEDARVDVGNLFDIIGGVIDDVVARFKAAGEAVDTFFDIIGGMIDTVVTDFKAAGEAVDTFFDKISNSFGKIKGVFDSIKNFLGEEVETTVNAVANTIQQQPGFAFAAAQGNALGPPAFTPPVFSAPRSGNTVNSNAVTNNNTNTVNINGGDVNAVRRAVDDVINGKIEQASNNAQSPVRS